MELHIFFAGFTITDLVSELNCVMYSYMYSYRYCITFYRITIVFVNSIHQNLSSYY